MSDLVSRQAAIDIFDKWLSYEDYNYSERNIMNCAIAEIKELPSAEKTGHWIEYDDSAEVQCDKCGRVWSMFSNEVNTFLYCPACGAKMESEDKE